MPVAEPWTFNVIIQLRPSLAHRPGTVTMTGDLGVTSVILIKSHWRAAQPQAVAVVQS
jgi:hypothetical protein